MSQEITQQEADRIWGGEESSLWLVAGVDLPEVRLRAPDRAIAMVRYFQLCGVLSHPYPLVVQRIEAVELEPQPAEYGLKEFNELDQEGEDHGEEPATRG